MSAAAVGEMLPSKPGLVEAGPCLPAGADDAVARQQLGQAVSAPHQIAADIVTGAHEITGGLLPNARNPDLDDLIHPQHSADGTKRR